MHVLITGATGYLGRRLVPALVARGHQVRALVRNAAKLPAGATPILGNVLLEADVAGALRPGDTLVHLVGTPRPSPRKAVQFQQVDLPSIRASVSAAKQVGVAQIVYLSIAHPAPIMRAYQDVRAQGEAMIADAALTATVLRPWYVIGPGHWWPVAVIPFYSAAMLFPHMRESASRLGLVTLSQMTNALVHAVENLPAPCTQRVVDVRHIRATKI